jgi:16S rRNA (guanine527-N7)-methyltransferase
LTSETIAELLQPYLHDIVLSEKEMQGLSSHLVVYLDLILKWNARTNLTAIRTPNEIVRRHFGESLFAGAHIGESKTLLDFGSGAGFPGIPIQLLRPELHVTLAESQGKKAAFLQEVCRALCLSTEVFSARVETMPPERQFDVVTLRAVDNMNAAYAEAARRARHRVITLTTEATERTDAFAPVSVIPIPESTNGVLSISLVPRGTFHSGN